MIRENKKPKYQYVGALVKVVASHMLVNEEWQTFEGYLESLHLTPAETAILRELFPDGDDTNWEAELW